MKAKIIYLNTEISSCCDICLNTILGRIKKAHLVFNLNESEQLEAKKRLLFFSKNILICFRCIGANSPKEFLWQKVLALPELPNLDLKKEYEFKINALSYP